MDELLTFLAIALGPVVVVFTMVFMLDGYEREPIKLLVGSFIFGILSAVPALFSEIWLKDLFLLREDGMSAAKTMLLAFVVVALSEEGFKFMALRLFAYPKKDFNEPYDGIMYAVAVSMGFAAIENVLYVWQGGNTVGFLRMFTAIPAHGAFAHLMGYFMGKAKFAPTPGARFVQMGIGLLLAVLAHGAYDFFLMWNDAAWAIFSLVTLVTILILAWIAIRTHRRHSPFRNPPTQV